MRPTLSIAAVAVVLAGVAPASASAQRAGPVTPVEPLADYVKRFRATVVAVRAGDCRTVMRLGRGTGVPCTREFARALGGFRTLGFRRFGTGAILDFEVGGPEAPRVFSLPLAIGTDRRFSAGVGSIVGGGSGRTQTRTRPTARATFLSRRAVNLLVLSLRRRDCTLFYRTAYTGGLTRAQACQRAFSARGGISSAKVLGRDVSADRTARPVLMGATRDFAFFRLVPGGTHHYTLIVSRAGPPDARFVVQAVRAR